MTEILSLNEEDFDQISNALSLIWTKMKYRVRNIAITDRTGTISYGKRIERLTVRLQDSTHIITNQVHIIIILNIHIVIFFICLKNIK
jgi:hypothetical protein